MNLFLVGWSPERAVDLRLAERSLTELTQRLPFFEGRDVERWAAPSGCAAATWVSHSPDQIGGVRYVHAESQRFACFAGRPLFWREERADGRSPLEPSTYLDAPERWRDALDGRAVVLRYEDGARTLDLATDPLGAYPVYSRRFDGAVWVSNNPFLLGSLGDRSNPDVEVLASFLGGGWSLSGHPVFSAVRRIPRGARWRLRPEREEREEGQWSVERIAGLFAGEANLDQAARVTSATLAGLADWPGRPNVVPVTDGRDSRVVLAAALRSGLSFEAVTGGSPASPDVVTGRALCDQIGIRHRTLEGEVRETALAQPEASAGILALMSAGTVSLHDASFLSLRSNPGRFVLWHSGQGGEIARAYYGQGASSRHQLVDQLVYLFLRPRPGRPMILSQGGRHLVRQHVDNWVSEQLARGAAARDVPDLFYLFKRMGTWAGPCHGCVEYVRDVTAPLWSVRLLPHMLGLSPGERALETFHLRLVETMSQSVAEVPFADRAPWPARQSALERRRRRLAGWVRLGRAEARVRFGPRQTAEDDRFVDMFELVRARVLDKREHPAWTVLDRPEVERLLLADPLRLNRGTRHLVWNLGTLFLTDLFD